jgi:hypothetical protein
MKSFSPVFVSAISGGRARSVVRRLASIVLLGLLPGLTGLRGAPTHEVTVFSSLTAAGRKFGAGARPEIQCALASGGYRPIGGYDSDCAATAPTRILNLVALALTKNSFDPRRQESPPALLIVCHWGHVLPSEVDGGAEFEFERAQRLALVGGAVLSSTLTRLERETILTAANDQRYFVIVSAYDWAAYSERDTKQLLWRSQMSVPSYGLSANQAWPMLTAAGAALFGRETPFPRRIALHVAGILAREISPW